MIKVKSKYFLNKLYEALNTIQSERTPQLISVSAPIEHLNVFGFYQAGAHYAGSRSFWMNADRSLTLVGVGSAYTIEAKSDRFKAIETEWSKILEDADIHNQSDVPGTGPVLLGGFSFDPNRTGSEKWSNFPDSKFSVPMFLLTEYQEQSYLTVNVLVQKEDHLEQLYAHLTQEMNHLLEHDLYKEVKPTVTGTQEINPSQWKETVHKATMQIREGFMDKVVLARELKAQFSHPCSVATLLESVTEQQPQSFVFAIESGGDCFFGATPERLVKVNQGEVLSTCLAGTAPRGETLAEDEQLGQDLLHDQKNLQEHEFVVQMIRKAIESCSTDVEIPAGPVLYPLRNVQHLYTPVKGNLKQGSSLLSVVERLHPTPALGGFPRAEAMSFIRAEEDMDRGWYAAPVGWLDGKSNGEFGVAIRSALLSENEAYLYAGCGIVADSDPEAEYEETAIKFSPMLHVLGGSQ
ncbi:isochorismate synthase [Pontibacillus halophilus JSM 076056 = DSM 19796]|uniref:Isochorismate synthase MenF n=1 Tax=Pontibacillus halophilus JSM 076056 = DSM 19796 TaxID=1385510 RepID=A0A0A5G8R3_9BACI|nr:isochorismate synthase [Pontibacillus halophilus]KGX89516.1 isochorismate synthase [Pontibacillus halophilus JSM 076056 = DSM 19796]